jgi:hypothetical protein
MIDSDKAQVFALRDHMVAELAQEYVTPQSDETTRAAAVRAGFEHYGSMQLIDLFWEYTNHIRQSEREQTWLTTKRVYDTPPPVGA